MKPAKFLFKSLLNEVDQSVAWSKVQFCMHWNRRQRYLDLFWQISKFKTWWNPKQTTGPSRKTWCWIIKVVEAKSSLVLCEICMQFSRKDHMSLTVWPDEYNICSKFGQQWKFAWSQKILSMFKFFKILKEILPKCIFLSFLVALSLNSIFIFQPELLGGDFMNTYQ